MTSQFLLESVTLNMSYYIYTYKYVKKYMNDKCTLHFWANFYKIWWKNHLIATHTHWSDIFVIYMTNHQWIKLSLQYCWGIHSVGDNCPIKTQHTTICLKHLFSKIIPFEINIRIKFFNSIHNTIFVKWNTVCRGEISVFNIALLHYCTDLLK